MLKRRKKTNKNSRHRERYPSLSMKLPLADALVSLIATGCLGVYQVTKRVIDPYLSFKREGRGFRRQQQPPKTFVFFGKTLAVWRVVNFTSYVLNVLCVSIPGRIDDQMAKEMKEAQELSLIHI